MLVIKEIERVSADWTCAAAAADVLIHFIVNIIG